MRPTSSGLLWTSKKEEAETFCTLRQKDFSALFKQSHRLSQLVYCNINFIFEFNYIYVFSWLLMVKCFLQTGEEMYSVCIYFQWSIQGCITFCGLLLLVSVMEVFQLFMGLMDEELRKKLFCAQE